MTDRTNRLTLAADLTDSETTMSDLITDAMVEAAAKVFANHEYRTNGPEMVPFCSCGWATTERYGVTEYDQHVARLTLEATAPLIAAKAWEEGYAECSRGRMWESANPSSTAGAILMSDEYRTPASRPCSCIAPGEPMTLHRGHPWDEGSPSFTPFR